MIFYYIFHVKPHFLKTLFQSRLLFDFDDFLYARLLRRDVLWYTDCPSVCPIPWPIHFKLRTDIGIDSLTVCILFGEISNFHSRVMGLYSSNCRQFFVSRCKLRTPWPIHFKLRIVIGIDSLMICILFGEISIFHSRVMGLYSSNCRRFFVCRAVN